MKTKSWILFLTFIILTALSIYEADLITRKLLASISLIIGVLVCREFTRDADGSLDETPQFYPIQQNYV
jgi:hypothetical protein